MKNPFSSYKYPLLVIGILLIAGGIFAYRNLNTGLFPNITFPKIKVIAETGQQPVDKMMAAVTIPLENAIRRTQGLNYIKSTTSRGSTEISVFLNWDMDINVARSQIESFINQAQGNILPNTRFTVEKMNPSILPVMGYSLEGDLSQVDLKVIAKYQIRPYLSATPGVSDIAIIGGRDKEYRITLKPQVLKNMGLSLTTVQNAVKNSNIIESDGYLTDYNRMYLTLTDNSIKGLEDLRNLVIKNSSTRLIQLKDVADVSVDAAKQYVKINANGKDVPLIAVIKQPSANLIAVNDSIERKVEQLTHILPKTVKMVPYYKQANFVNTSIRSIKDVLWIGLVLAIVVVVVFLRSYSSSMVVLFTIPVSLSLTFIVLDAIGYTFNIMTLGAIAAAIGLMIDDVVIILEQIYKIREENPHEDVTWCAREAISNLFPAMVGSSLSTLVIFIPFVMMTGVAGAYFQVMAFTMIIALACSFFVTWFMVPVLAILFSRNRPVRHTHEPKTQWIHRILENSWIGISFAAICVAIIVLLPSKLPSGFLPEMDEGSIILDFNSPPGTTLEETGRMLTIVNDILRDQPEVEAFSARLGTQLGFFITEPNRGDYLIKLKESRSKTTDEVSDEIRTKVEAKLPQFTADFGQVITDMLGDLTSSVQPIQIKLFGDDKAKLHEISKKIASEVEQVEGTADVFDGIVIAGPEIQLKPHVPELAQLGLSPADLQLQLQTQIAGTVVSTMIDNTRIIDIRMLYPNTYETSVQDLRNTTILLPNGSSAPITQLAEVIVKKGVAEVDRENEKTVGYITARLNNRDLGSTYADIKSRLNKNLSLPANFHLEYGGSYQQQQQAFHELLMILISAFLLVFAVILFLFRKIKIAAAIVFIAIFGVAGCLLSLFLTGTPLNVGSYMGIIMIVGIIGENSIFTYRQYQEVDEELSHEKKIEYAIAARLRPKLMTAFAAIIALTPLALGIGAGAQLHQPLAIAVIGGMIFALPLLLVVLPTIFKIIKE